MKNEISTQSVLLCKTPSRLIEMKEIIFAKV
jgi:hypothetical protein